MVVLLRGEFLDFVMDPGVVFVTDLPRGGGDKETQLCVLDFCFELLADG